MTTIRKIVELDAPIKSVWAKIEDTGGISNLIGFLGNSVQKGNDRVCTLKDGGELHEKIISVDADLNRVVYSITKSPLNMEYHVAVMELEKTEKGSRLVWTVDLLPNEAAAHMEPMLDAACIDFKANLTA